jgi:CDP-diacylglycerol---glycerol-3-phosphate 3-phosphatidyltransferase
MAQAAAPRSSIFQPGNLLTTSRLVLLPVIIAGVVENLGWLALGGMVAAWITDLLDGRLARRLGQAGPFGKTLDSPIDFVLIYSLFMTFYASGRLETWQFLILYLGMFATLLLQLSTSQAGEVVSTKLSKVAGALEYTFLIFLVVAEVLEPTPLLAQIKLAFFLVLAAGVVGSVGENLWRVRRAERETAAEG